MIQKIVQYLNQQVPYFYVDMYDEEVKTTRKRWEDWTDKVFRILGCSIILICIYCMFR